MGRKDPKPYIKKSDSMITKPAVCEITGEEIPLQNGGLVYLSENHRPLSEEHKDEASYIASVGHAGGYPNNGIDPETGEPQALGRASWWKLQDIKEI